MFLGQRPNNSFLVSEFRYSVMVVLKPVSSVYKSVCVGGKKKKATEPGSLNLITRPS